jgi:hypothetical protein
MRFPPGLLLFLSLFLLQASSGSVETKPGTGIKMTVQIGFDKNESQYTSYIERDRKRMEYQSSMGGGMHADGTLDMRPGPHLASITRCDLGQTFELNLEDREYDVVFPYSPHTLTKTEIAARDLAVPRKIDSAPPTVRIETTTVDTGERRELFGHLARHVITTWKETLLAGLHAEPQETVTDGWYIDLDTSITCDFKWPGDKGSHAHLRRGLGLEKYEFVDKGNPETGLAVERELRSRRTLTTPNGTKTEIAYTSELRITEFTEGSLDPALFEIPPNFRKVDDISRNPPLTLADRWFYTQSWFRAVAKSVFK